MRRGRWENVEDRVAFIKVSLRQLKSTLTISHSFFLFFFNNDF